MVRGWGWGGDRRGITGDVRSQRRMEGKRAAGEGCPPKQYCPYPLPLHNGPGAGIKIVMDLSFPWQLVVDVIVTSQTSRVLSKAR